MKYLVSLSISHPCLPDSVAQLPASRDGTPRVRYLPGTEQVYIQGMLLLSMETAAQWIYVAVNKLLQSRNENPGGAVVF